MGRQRYERRGDAAAVARSSQQLGFELCREAIRDGRLVAILRSRKLWIRAVPELANMVFPDERLTLPGTGNPPGIG